MSPPRRDPRSKAELVEELARSRARLEEAESTLQAIRDGEVDALVVHGPAGDRVYSLTGADQVYRVIVEQMNEGALTVSEDGVILFCNQRFCGLMRTPMPEAIGRRVSEFAPFSHQDSLQELLGKARRQPSKKRLTLRARDGAPVPAQIAASRLDTESGVSICLVVSDLTELEASVQSARELREYQDSLAASEARFRTLVEVAPDGIVILQEGRLVYANPAALALYAAGTRDDLLARRFLDLVQPKDVNALVTHALPAPEQQGLRRELRLVRLDGREVPVEFVSTLTEWQGQPAVQLLIRDVSERRRAEAALAEQARSWAVVAATGAQLLRTATPDELFHLLAEQIHQLAGGSIVMVSEYLAGSNQLVVRSIEGPQTQVARLESILERSPIGLTLSVDPAQRFEAGFRRVTLQELTFGQLTDALCASVERALRLTQVCAVPFAIDGELLGAVALLTDRPEGLANEQFIEALANQAALALRRLRAEEARRLSEERYRSLFESMSEGFTLCEIICDDQGQPVDFRFLEVNRAFEQMTGLAPADVVCRTVREILPSIEPIWIERYGQVALTGRPDSFEAFAGDLGRWYGVHAFRSAPGQFAVVFIDITERRQAEAEFRQAVAEHAIDRLYETLREFQHGEGLALNLHRLALFAQNVELLCPDAITESSHEEQQAVTIARERLDVAVREFRAVGRHALLRLAALLSGVESEFSPPEIVSGAEIKRLAEALNGAVEELLQEIGPGQPGVSPAAQEAGRRIADQVESLQRNLSEVMRHLRTRYTADVAEVAATVATSFALASPAAIEVENDGPGTRALISAPEFSDLLKLLISNSLDALAGRVRVRIRGEADAVVVEVEDTGPGVPAELRDRLFEKGFSTKGEGRGNGLAFARDHLGRYGGTLAYDDGCDGGARFRVTLVRV